MDRQELLWRQYELHVSLYKFYLELTLKINAAFYAIAGAIATYTLSHETAGAATRAALLVPAVLGIGLAVVAVYAAIIQDHTRNELIAIRDSLELQTIPEIKVLGWLLWVSAFGFAAVAIGLVWLWCS